MLARRVPLIRPILPVFFRRSSSFLQRMFTSRCRPPTSGIGEGCCQSSVKDVQSLTGTSRKAAKTVGAGKRGMIYHEVLTTEKVPFSYRVAGLGSRFLAWLIDAAAVLILIEIGVAVGSVLALGRLGL